MLGLGLCIFWPLGGKIAELFHGSENLAPAVAIPFLAAGIAFSFVGLAQTAHPTRRYWGHRAAIAGVVIGFAWVALYIAILTGIFKP